MRIEIDQFVQLLVKRNNQCLGKQIKMFCSGSYEFIVWLLFGCLGQK